jgi:hypothetical protein
VATWGVLAAIVVLGVGWALIYKGWRALAGAKE